MRNFKLGLAIVAFCSIFASCQNSQPDYRNDTVYLTPLNKQSKQALDEGITLQEMISNAEIDFNTNRNWSASESEIQNGATQWCHFSPTQSKSGNTQFTISTDANTTGYDRNTVVTIKADTIAKRILITQKRENSILLTKDRYDINCNGGQFTAQIKPNSNCKVTIDEDCKNWIKQSVNPQDANSIDFTISKSENNSPRQGHIFCTNGKLSDTIRVNQSNAALIVSEKVLNISENAKQIMVDLNMAHDFTVTMPQAGWIHNTKAGMSSHTLMYTVDQNTDAGNRSTQIVFTNLADNSKDTLSINQYQHGALIIKTKKFDVAKDGQQIAVDVQSNEDFEYAVPSEYASWISVAPTTKNLNGGLIDHIVKFNVSANTSDARIGKILFRAKGTTQYSDTIDIISNKVLYHTF